MPENLNAILERAVCATTVRTVLLAGLVVSCAAHPQNAPAPDLADRQTQLLERLDQVQAQGGENSTALIEPLTDLGLFLEGQGDLTLAIGAFERARKIMRVNYGFSRLEEAALLQHLVRTEEARGNAAVAWQLEQEALALANQHPRDIRSAQIFGVVAENRMKVLERYQSGDYPPQIVLGCYYAKIGSIYEMLVHDAGFITTPPMQADCTNGDRDVALLALLMEARSYCVAALEVVLGNGGYASDELGDFLVGVLDKTERLRQLLPQYRDPMIGELLGRLLAYEPDDSLSLLRHAEILVHAADLGVLRAHTARRPAGLETALAQYQQAFRELGEARAGPAATQALFSPEMPIVLPALETNPLVSAAGPDGAGDHIDVAFNITKYGRSEQVLILDATAGATRSAKKHLVRFIENGSFRPRIANGRIADAAPVVLRYYPQEPRE